MKYLIDANLVALRKGEFVEANEEAQEFIYDSSNADSISIATASGIADANKFKISGSKKPEILASLNAGLETLKLSEVATKPESAIVAEIVAAGIAADKSDEEMLLEIVNAGVSFKRTLSLFKAALEASGLRVSTKERMERVAVHCDEVDFAPTSYDDVADMIQWITGEIPGTSVRQAYAALQKWAKGVGIELPKQPKEAVAKVGFRQMAYDWMVSNPEATYDDLLKYIVNAKRKDPEAVAKRIWGIFEFGKRMAGITV